MGKWHCGCCIKLYKEIDRLKKQNDDLAQALAAQVSRHSNTDLLLGAELSGGDVVSLAKTLVKNGVDRVEYARKRCEGILETLKVKYPKVGLSFGYIGNCETWGDDRSWMFFTQVQQPDHPDMRTYSFGGYKTEDLPLLLNEAECFLEGWIESSVLPGLGGSR